MLAPAARSAASPASSATRGSTATRSTSSGARRNFAVEIDGYDAHSGRVAFERDRLKSRALNAHGMNVMPVTGRQIGRDPDGVIRRLLAALA